MGQERGGDVELCAGGGGWLSLVGCRLGVCWGGAVCWMVRWQGWPAGLWMVCLYLSLVLVNAPEWQVASVVFGRIKESSDIVYLLAVPRRWKGKITKIAVQ